MEKEANEKIIFVKCIEKTDRLINYFGNLFIETPNKELLNKFFNVKQVLTFRRSYQDFYIIWLILDSISLSEENDFKESLLSDIRSLLCMLRNVNGVSVNEKYLNDFIGNMEAIRNKYKNKLLWIVSYNEKVYFASSILHEQTTAKARSKLVG